MVPLSASPASVESVRDAGRVADYSQIARRSPQTALIPSSAKKRAGDGRPIRLCVVATIGDSIQVLYAGRLEYLSAHGFEVTVVCAASELDDEIRRRGVSLRTVAFTRTISPLQDLRAFVQLARVFRAEQFDVIEVATPKAALIGALAARWTRARRVVHILHGAPYEGKRSLLGVLLRAATAVPCRLAHVTVAVSPSVARRVCADRLGTPRRTRVFGAGSTNGVDLDRFSPARRGASGDLRKRWRIAADAVVIGFVGRLVRDKGLNELTRAFAELHVECPNTILLVVGDYEVRDRPSPDAIRMLATHPGVRHVGVQWDVVPFMAAMDVVALPTYREGLGNVLLEAAALAIPTVTTDATGACDAIDPGRTGLRVRTGSVEELKKAMATLVRDSRLRRRMGDAGRAWVAARFEQRNVWRRQASAYRALCAGARTGVR